MRPKSKPVESHIFAGMEGHVTAQAEAAAEYSGEELSKELLRPIGDVSRKVQDIENNSPLFYGKVNPTLF